LKGTESRKGKIKKTGIIVGGLVRKKDSFTEVVGETARVP